MEILKQRSQQPDTLAFQGLIQAQVLGLSLQTKYHD